MKNKSIRKSVKKSLFIIILFLLIPTGVYFLNATIIEGRSIRSRIYEDVIRLAFKKSGATDFNKISSEMGNKLNSEEVPYTIPTDIKLRNMVSRQEFEGMSVYSFEQKDSITNKNILYIHGGGYINGISKTHMNYADKLVSQVDYFVHIPDYPLAPKHTYEEAYDKLLKLYANLLQETAAENIIIMGDSSGGGFALGLAMLIKDKELEQPKEIILISPWLDLTVSNPSITDSLKKDDPVLDVEVLRYIGEYWAGDQDTSYYQLSPINGDLSNLPPITIFIGTKEIFLPDAILLKDTLESLNAQYTYYEYKNMIHGFPLFDIPEAEDALNKVVGVIER